MMNYLKHFMIYMMNLKILVKIYNLRKRDYVSLTNEFDASKNNYDNYMSISYTKYKVLESLKKKNMLLQQTLENFKTKNKLLNMILAN